MIEFFFNAPKVSFFGDVLIKMARCKKKQQKNLKDMHYVINTNKNKHLLYRYLRSCKSLSQKW
jgi:hypothetical protein